MKRVVLTGLILLTVAPAAHAAPGGVSAKVAQCSTGLDPAARQLVVDGAMTPFKPTRRMAQRFTLLAKPVGSAAFSAVATPGSDKWIRSPKPNLARYGVEKIFSNLSAPAQYKMRVGFRWYGADGRVLRTRFRTTGVCDQPDFRPDLRLLKPSAQRVGKGVLRYDVRVRNDGRTAAGPFAVTLAGLEGGLQSQELSGVPAGRGRDVSFQGPRCAPGTRLTISVDPAQTVDESDESDNVLSLACPARAG